MAVKKFNTRIQLKRDSSTNFDSFSPLAGELLVVTDKNNVKIGDGSTGFANLPYLVGGATLASYTAPTSATTGDVTNTDTLDQALAKLQKCINDAAGGVLSIGGATGTVTVGNGLQSTVGAGGSVSAKTTGYIVANTGTNSDSIGIDPNQVDSTYITNDQVNTSTDLATVATVTAAIGTLDVTAFSQAAITTTAGSGASTLTINGISETDGKIAADSTANVDLEIDGTYNASTNKIATQSTVQNAINNALDSEVTFKGITATQPTSPENGDMWKASGAITVSAQDDGQGAGFTTKAGDTIIYKYDSASGATGNGWYLIPSADDVEDTWRPVNVGGTELLGSGLSTGAVNFAGAQDNPVTVTGSSNTVTVQHGTITAPTAPTATPKTQGQTVTAITGLTEDGYGHVTAYTTDSFTIPTVNDGALTISGATGGPITVAPTGSGYTANSASGETYTITHAAKPTTLTPAAVKVAVDDYGHAQTGDALTSDDIATVAGDPGHGTGTTVSDSLQELSTQITNNAAGTLNTTATTAQTTSASESLHGNVTLHKISKTANTDDLIQGLTILLDCGTATLVTDTEA